MSSNSKIVLYAAVVIIIILLYDMRYTSTHNGTGIVGAGPAGMLIALELHKIGVRDITIYGDPACARVRSELIHVSDKLQIPVDTGASGVSLAFGTGLYDLIKFLNLEKELIRYNFTDNMAFMDTTMPLTKAISQNDLIHTKEMLMHNAVGYGPFDITNIYNSAYFIQRSNADKYMTIPRGIHGVMNKLHTYLVGCGVKFVSKNVDTVVNEKIDNVQYNKVVIACDPRKLCRHPLQYTINPITSSKYFIAIYTVNHSMLRKYIPWVNAIIPNYTPLPNYASMIMISPPIGDSCILRIYGYGNNKALSTSHCMTLLNRIMPYTTPVQRFFHIWDMNIRFTHGLEHKDNHAQTWYTGGLYSHDDIASIATHSITLAKKICG